ncbi:L-fuconolactone hydrolase (plasmid) [Paraburkholderia caribensis MBA4]|uniref:L-fuconolactone hydrolase n=1 Tax=Paraburkholderia caribensis MBA4 TaxID=1323664 RepID=A0A0P0RQP4_9BURK|nr:amidohydrolase family protein [Paraburkholderia caribensis]ALL71319.1 L-fuconolactone hydrolase [Paraburkholderia caribensis MBA4]
MIDFPIIDSHVHLIDRHRFDYSWSSGSAWAAGATKLQRDWAAEDLSNCSKPYQVEGFVFVEADVDPPQYLEETEWISSAASVDSRILGCVACLPLERGASIEPEMARVSKLRSVRGVRRLIQNMPDSSVILHRPFLDAINLLPKYELSFDLCIDPHQFPHAIELVRQSPAVSFVLDHMGKPEIKEMQLDFWDKKIQQIATFPNVVCKISGLLTQADHTNWTQEQVLPLIEHVIDFFGVDRVLFGGDWPVLELAANYGEWVNIVDHATRHFSTVDRLKIFRDNTIRIYRLGV